MNQKNFLLFILIFVSILISSCADFKKAVENANKYEKSMTELRSQVYQSVLDSKKSKAIDSNKLKELKAQYLSVQQSFNKIFDKIIANIDSSKLDKAKCVVLNYKIVLMPYENDFKNSSKLATDFNESVVKARGGSAIGIPDLVPLTAEILKAVSKYRINICKDKITGLKFKAWDDIQ